MTLKVPAIDPCVVNVKSLFGVSAPSTMATVMSGALS